LGAGYEFDSRVVVGICFVLLLVRGTRKWVAVIYLHSKLKLSLHKIPQYLPGAGSREQGAGSREQGTGHRVSVADRAAGYRGRLLETCLFFDAEASAFENAVVSRC
jgi:hypothetical protein